MSERSLWEKLKRRHVVKVGVAYIVVAAGVGGAADAFLPGLGAPGWILPTVLGLLVLGLPVALVLAWAYELTPEGIVRDAPEPASEEPPAEAIAPLKVSVAAGRKSILVLPFDNMSPDPDNEYFSDGLTEEIIADLSQIRALRVISRTSAMQLKGSAKDARTIGQELGVRYLLEGSVRRSGTDLRIVAQLIDADRDDHLWADKYDGSVDEVFEIQEKVANAIAEALRVRLSAGERAALGDAPIRDLKAHESYLRARHQILRLSEESLDQAIRDLENALEIVGDNELLYATLGHVHVFYLISGASNDLGHLDEAQACADKVFELSPESAHGHRLQGVVLFTSGDLRASGPPLERALEINPDDPDSLLMLGYLYALQGRHAPAAELFRRLLEVDPLTPMSHAMPGFLAALEGR